MKYTTYLFDFDYTLADSSRGIVICFRNVLERHGHTGISDEAIKRTIGKTLEDSFSILSGIKIKKVCCVFHSFKFSVMNILFAKILSRTAST